MNAEPVLEDVLVNFHWFLIGSIAGFLIALAITFVVSKFYLLRPR